MSDTPIGDAVMGPQAVDSPVDEEFDADEVAENGDTEADTAADDSELPENTEGDTDEDEGADAAEAGEDMGVAVDDDPLGAGSSGA